MLSTVRLSRNKQRPVFIFKMVNMDSDYVGTEQKIDLVGTFDCVCETVRRSKTDDTKTEKDVVCKMTVPTGYHFKVGFMASFDSDTKPDMKIISVSSYSTHCVCELIAWK